jgi:tRNA (cmo5U34)-methyltransferase
MRKSGIETPPRWIDQMEDKDRLFETTIEEPDDFVFDDRVVKVFPDMIRRSVPGYGLIVPMIGLLARRYAQAGSRLYDLGCSLGAVSLAMQSAVRAEQVEIVAVDNSPHMVRQLEQRLETEAVEAAIPILPIRRDILETQIENASVVVLNFTLQFIRPADREALLQRVAAGLLPGGILVLSEKICFEDPDEQLAQQAWHHDFKRAQGYSELEIARKREALENVMIPDSRETHHERLARAGFASCYQWFQGFNFISLVARK